jgi:2-deoxy-D-gluconate 3-dehydrogenase
MIAAAAGKMGGIDILVNCAGMAIRKRPEALNDAEWRQVLDVNLTGTFACAQAAYPHMQKRGGGKIINIGSMLSIFGAAPNAAYAASKGAVVQFTKSLAVAWAKDNIQVNAILPGWIDTELTVAARRQIEGLNERVLARTPAGRWGRPDEFAGIAVFLASEASAFVTGTAIPVDGGFSVMV